MTETTTRWGLLSTARINDKVLPALAEVPRAEALAVASRDAATARAYAETRGLARAYGSYDDLLADPDIDVVYVSLPNHLHATWTIRAAEAGKHVLCEKPIALSVVEVDAIAAAAAANAVVVTEAFMYRSHPQTVAITAMIARGDIGDVRLVRGSFSFTLTNSGDPRLEPSMGGGCAWDVGVYPISFARNVFGRAPETVTAHARYGPTGVDLDCHGTLDFGDGAVALFDASFALPYRTNVEIVGTDGVILVANPFKPTTQAVIGVGPASDRLQEVVVTAERSLYAYEIEDLIDAVQHGRRPTVDLADSRANTATLQAVLDSAAHGGARVRVLGS